MRIRIQMEHEGRILKESGFFIPTSRVPQQKIDRTFEALTEQMFLTADNHDLHARKGDKEWQEPADF